MILNKEMRGRGSNIRQKIIKPKGLKNSSKVQSTLPYPRNVPMILNKEMRGRGSNICQKIIRPMGLKNSSKVQFMLP